MSEWTEEKLTGNLRVAVYRVVTGLNPFDVKVKEKLQQEWMVTRGGTGKVTYDYEWRDVPIHAEQGNG